MKLIVLKQQLNEAIQYVSKAISNKTTLPILNGIKIDADHKGMTLTASDTEISIQSFIPIEKNDETVIRMERKGSVVLPAKFFVEIIKKLPAKEVEIDVKEQFQTLIRSGSSEIQLVGLDPEEYPLLPKVEENNIFSIPGDLLKTMIKQTIFSVSANEATPILTGVLWSLNNGRLKFVATDRHRLASQEVQISASTDQNFQNIVIPGKTLAELNKIIPDQNTLVDIVVADNQVLFKVDSVLFYSRILDGTYPDTTRIIPSVFKTELVLNTKELADAIDRAYLLSREEKTNIVRLMTLEDQTIEISSSSSELGKVTELLPVSRMDGEALKISFNSKYMLDSLKVIDSEQLLIGFTGTMSPIIIRPNDHSQILHLILPYRTTN